MNLAFIAFREIVTLIKNNPNLKPSLLPIHNIVMIFIKIR
tara:strand:+ start:511 stop:630 length:120 start_codon:yes stop_codon:yes gene_type:complete